jgi:hypothetical protein
MDSGSIPLCATKIKRDVKVSLYLFSVGAVSLLIFVVAFSRLIFVVEASLLIFRFRHIVEYVLHILVLFKLFQ